MSTKHTITILGDTTHDDAVTLIGALGGAGITTISATPNSRFALVLLLLTGEDVPESVWPILEHNRSARILPVILTGGKLPALFADIKPADFSKDPVRALAALLQAIDKFT